MIETTSRWRADRKNQALVARLTHKTKLDALKAMLDKPTAYGENDAKRKYQQRGKPCDGIAQQNGAELKNNEERPSAVLKRVWKTQAMPLEKATGSLTNAPSLKSVGVAMVPLVAAGAAAIKLARRLCGSSASWSRTWAARKRFSRVRSVYQKTGRRGL